MANVLVVCPTHRDRRELAAIGADRRHRFRYFEYASQALEDLTAGNAVRLEGIERVVSRLLDDGAFSAVFSVDDYPGSALASILAQAKGLPGTPPEANLLCQHKLHSRLAQRSVAPEAVPRFVRVDPRRPGPPPFAPPFFLKPSKSFFSVGARRVDAASDWRRAVREASLPARFFKPLDAMLERYTGLKPDGPSLLAEGLLEGAQTTVEGWAFQGEVHVMGVVDSVFFPGTISFERFEYPSRLSAAVQARMAALARRLMSGLGYGHGQFNVEMIHDPRSDGVGIVEINPRMSSQFADLFEKVDGVNSYRVALDLALGRRPPRSLGKGRHRAAASFVLRSFEDVRAVRVPGPSDVARVLSRHPDARVEVFAEPGRRLSEQMQDPESFRYGLVNLGGRDRRRLEDAYAECLRLLPFEFRVPPAPGGSARRGRPGRSSSRRRPARGTARLA